MFKIYTNDILMYNDENSVDSLKVISPKLSLSQSSAGTFIMTVPPGNVGYDHLNRMTDLIRIYKNSQEIPYWEGRILSEETDFWNCKNITCEGILGVLNDTIQPPYHYQNITARSFLEAILDIHNQKVEEWKRIYVGNVDVSLGSHHRYTNYETTLDCINEKLIEIEGGYIQLRYDPIDGKRYLDYLSDYHEEHAQKIEFGKNLLDFTKSFSSEDYCTVLVPRGEQLVDGPYDALTAYFTVESVNGGSIYVTLTNDDFETPPDVLPVDEFGWIESVHDWDDVSDPSNLLRKAKTYLKDLQFDNMELTVNAFDLNYAGGEYEDIYLNDSVRVISSPHGLDKLFPVTKMEIPLDEPTDTVFTLGSSVKVSLTHREKTNNTAILNEIANLPTEQSIVNKMKVEAANMIESAITGYITIINNEETGAQELIISHDPDYRTSSKLWRWNLNGLAYTNQGYDSGNYELALTANGEINANLISTGTMIADRVRGGKLVDSETNGQKFYVNLNTGEVRIKTVEERIDDYYASSTEQINITNQNLSTFIGRVEGENGLVAELNSRITQTSSDITAEVNRKIENVDGKIEEVRAKFIADVNGLRIVGTYGSSDGSYLLLAADQVALYEGNVKRLWLNSDGANAISINSNSFVGINDFMWERYSNGFRLRKRE